MRKIKKLTDEEIKEMISRGYCRTSRRFGIVSRIDREDWKEFCAKTRKPVDADWYRRCLSKDVIELGIHYGLKFPASHDSNVEFVK